jgi:hypothetical protein
MGKADYLQLGDYNARCYQCGFKFKASMLKKHWQGYWVCPTCWEPRQPQDFVRAVQDVVTPPWVQPQPSLVFVGGYCTTRSAVSDVAVSDCAISDYFIQG